MAKNEPLLATKRCVDIPIPFENAISSLMSALTSGPDEEIPIEEHTLLKRVGPAVGTYLSLEEKRVLENQFLFNPRIVYRENAKDLLTNILQRPSEEFCIFKKVAVGVGGGIFFGVMFSGMLASIPALSPVAKGIFRWGMFLGALTGGAAGYYYGANTCSGLSLSIEWIPQE